MKAIYLFPLFFGMALPGHAMEASAPQNYLAENIVKWADDPVLIAAILAQNAANMAITQADIDRLDLEWRANVGKADNVLITSVLSNPASDFLHQRVTEAGGVITEAFVMDEHGLNVAASGVTSDYWQGDEAKFNETFPKGAGAVHISSVEFDESSQTYQIQISIPMTNPADGTVIGAMTVALNAETL